MDMVERAAIDYAKILQTTNLEREIYPICTNIEDMLARLDEFETLLSSVKAETSCIMEEHVCSIVEFNDNFLALQERINNLKKFVDMVNANVDKVERAVETAEEELKVTDYSIRGLLKPLLAKAKSSDNTQKTAQSNLIDGEFIATPVFKTSDYFNGGDEETKTTS